MNDLQRLVELVSDETVVAILRDLRSYRFSGDDGEQSAWNYRQEIETAIANTFSMTPDDFIEYVAELTESAQ